MSFKVSVIVPIFNVDSFLENTLNSVINQTIGFENIELILVDDCSTDNSKNIIKKYAEKYNNIKPIYLKENSGSPVKPRNTGIKNSTAPYLIFLDSDDEFFEDYCEVLYNTIKEENVDIVHCQHTKKIKNKLYISKRIKNINSTAKKVVPNNEKIFLPLMAWGNIFKSSLIKNNDINFPNTFYEDGIFALKSYIKSTNIIELTNYPGYIYLVENDASFTHKISMNSLKNFLKGYGCILKLLQKNSLEEYEKEIFSNIFNMILFILFKVDNKKEAIKKIYAFESTLNHEIELKSFPLNFLNKKILNKQFTQALLITKLASLFYNNKIIRNIIFINYTNIKKISD